MYVANSDEESLEVACPTPEERAYFHEVEGMLDLLADQLRVRSSQFAMAERNESMLLDPQWQADHVQAGENIRLIAQDMRNVASPVSAVDYHADLVTAMGKIDQAMALANEATYEISIYKMETSNGLMREASQWLDYATDKKLAFCQ